MPSQDPANPPTDPWADDLLGRTALAAMLEDFVVREGGSRPEGLTVAIDGRWGGGKSFFVRRWKQQLETNNRGVVVFDAWRNDQALDPTLAFITDLRSQFHDLAKDVIDSNELERQLTQRFDAAVRSLSSLVKPIARVAVGGLMKRWIGAGLDEFGDAVSAAGGGEENDGDAQRAKLFDRALDAYLDRLMKDHEERKRSVEQFKIDLEALVESLVAASRIQGPLIVVVDELDRCRPDFAISLLEGVKHLFSVPNVVFVFATNVTQLSASIQAVYGQSFDGRDYLGRFFDIEVALPTPNTSQFSSMLFRSSDGVNPQQLDFGRYVDESVDAPTLVEGLWSGMCQSLGVSLRQQQQAFFTFKLALRSWPRGYTPPSLWLAFLSLLHKRSPDAFATLREGEPKLFDGARFREALVAAGFTDRRLSHLHDSSQPSLQLSSLVHKYYELAHRSSSEIRERYSTGRAPNPPDDEIVNLTYGPGSTRLRSVFHQAFALISTAGLFAST